MPIVNQATNSTLSLQGNGITATPTQPAWGFVDASANLSPAASKLQNTYSVDSIPQVRLKDFNRNGVTSVPAESKLDELDRNAPNLTAGGIVSQVYKSSTGRRYKDLGPADGRY